MRNCMTHAYPCAEMRPHIKEQVSTLRRAIERARYDVDILDISFGDGYALYDCITDHLCHLLTEAQRLEKWVNEQVTALENEGTEDQDCSVNPPTMVKIRTPVLKTDLEALKSGREPDWSYTYKEFEVPLQDYMRHAEEYQDVPPEWAKDSFNYDSCCKCWCGRWMEAVRPGKHQCLEHG